MHFKPNAANADQKVKERTNNTCTILVLSIRTSSVKPSKCSWFTDGEARGKEGKGRKSKEGKEHGKDKRK